MNDESGSTELNNDVPDMIDIVFDLKGTSVPVNYPFALWAEVVRCLPWLRNHESAGIIPLRGSVSGEALLLSRRTKLVLRLPASLAKDAEQLSGQQLMIDGSTLSIDDCKERPLHPATTLHAYLVESNLSEIEFLAHTKTKLSAMNVACNLICDKQREISKAGQILRGFGLVLHDLKPAASMQIQCTGLGGSRQFGCGIFVPFKAITGLD